MTQLEEQQRAVNQVKSEIVKHVKALQEAKIKLDARQVEESQILANIQHWQNEFNHMETQVQGDITAEEKELEDWRQEIVEKEREHSEHEEEIRQKKHILENMDKDIWKRMRY